jgi:hypothetical protein
MSRKSTRMIFMAFVALLATSRTAAHADQFTAANLRRAELNTRLLNQNARRQADGMAGKISAAKTTAPHGDGRRTRTEHDALTRQGNELNHLTMH